MKPKRPTLRYQCFSFDTYLVNFDQTREVCEIELNYSLDGREHFQEKLHIPLSRADWDNVDKDALDRALAALHIMAGISYYKAWLPPKISGLALTPNQAVFWQKTYQLGLGEFFYTNNIDFENLINFPVAAEMGEGELRKSESLNQQHPLRERCLLPIGGGKDSLVSAEILKANGEEITLFSLRDAEPIRATSAVIGRPRLIVQRQIAPRLLEMNKQGAYNGHVPITGYISFLLAICALLTDHRYIVMSLEKSANSGQLNWQGLDVNHQYSKSEEFEADFRQYVWENISTEIEYFSLLRPFNELRIAELMAALPNFDSYAPIFTSCNANFRLAGSDMTGLWCGHCPKCAFVFLILAPFVPKEKLITIFGVNMLDMLELRHLYEEILGLRDFKPFECVGTVEESRLAMWMIAGKAEWQEDILVKIFLQEWQQQLGEVDWREWQQEIMTPQEAMMVPERFRKYLENL